MGADLYAPNGKEIELVITPNPQHCRVLYGGEDISGLVRRIEVVAEMGKATSVRLDFVRGIVPISIHGRLCDTVVETGGRGE